MKTMTPQVVRLKAVLSGEDLAGRIAQVLQLAQRAKLSEPMTFETPLGSTARPFGQFDTTRTIDHQVEFALADDTRVAISTHPDFAGTLIDVSLAGDELREAAVVDAQKGQALLLRGLFTTGDLQSGHIERLESSIEALPDVPVAGKMPAIVVTEQQVAQAYADAAPFWAAWSDHLVEGDRHLLMRHLAVASTPAWFRVCFEDQWAMARAARPGDTFYGRKIAPPGCEQLLMQGESRLRQVGYQNGHVELAGFVPDGEHVPAWEVLAWREVLLNARLDNGSPVSNVRVVFRNEEMARREATPLLDIGAQVAFLGRDGNYQLVQ